MIPILFLGAAALSFLATGCSKDENLKAKSKPESFHPDTLKTIDSEHPPFREFLNREDFRKDRYHPIVPELYAGLRAAGVEEGKMDQGFLWYFKGGKPKRVGRGDKKISPLELFITALDAQDNGIKKRNFQKVFQKISSEPEFQLFYGKALFYGGRQGKAEKSFINFIEAEKYTYLGFSYLGDLFRLRGDYDNAERAYRTGLRELPQEFLTRLYLGDMLMDLKRYGAAEDVLLKLWDQGSHPEIVRGRLIQLYRRLDEPSNLEKFQSEAN